MKKFLLALAVISFMALPIVMNSCEEDNPVNCSADYLDLISQGDKTCSEYKSDLQNYIDKDCSSIYDTVLQDIVDGLGC